LRSDTYSDFLFAIQRGRRCPGSASRIQLKSCIVQMHHGVILYPTSSGQRQSRSGGRLEHIYGAHEDPLFINLGPGLPPGSRTGVFQERWKSWPASWRSYDRGESRTWTSYDWAFTDSAALQQHGLKLGGRSNPSFCLGSGPSSVVLVSEVNQMCCSKPLQGLHGTSVIQSEARETHVRLTVDKLDCTESKRVVLL
jgi:hypothetical protein